MRGHARSQAFEVEADAELVVLRPAERADALHLVERDDVRVRQHGGPASPPAVDLLGCAFREGDQGIGCWDEHVELGVVRGAVIMVGVAKVVHGVDQRPTRIRSASTSR